MILNDKDVGNHLWFRFYDTFDIESMIITFCWYSLMPTLNDYYHVFFYAMNFHDYCIEILRVITIVFYCFFARVSVVRWFNIIKHAHSATEPYNNLFLILFGFGTLWTSIHHHLYERIANCCCLSLSTIPLLVSSYHHKMVEQYSTRTDEQTVHLKVMVNCFCLLSLSGHRC